MEKLSPKKKLTLIRSYLSGLSYDEIAVKGGVSKGTVANVVAELKAGAFPEAADLSEQIELLRELSLDLKHAGLSAGQSAVGLAVLSRVKECGLDAADIDKWPKILKAAGTEDQAKGFVEVVYRIQEAEKKSGVTLEQADEKLHDLETKAAQLQPTLKMLQKRRQEVAALTKRCDNLVPVVNALDQKYALLNPRVKDLEKREGELSQQIENRKATIEKADTTLAALSKENLGLQKAGFSLESLAEFNDRARAVAVRHHVAVSGLRDRLLRELECLDKGLSLETMVEGRRSELKKCRQEIAAAKKEREGLQETVAVLEQHKVTLEASIKATREKVGDEIAKMVPMARETINRLAKELQAGNEAVLEGVRHLKDEALEVGKEIGRYEGMVKANEWLLELLALARGQDGLEAQRVRTILLQVLRGAGTWMKSNQAKAGLGMPTYATGRLIEELEQWRT